MPTKLALFAGTIAVGSLGFTVWNCAEYFKAAPLTTLSPYALTVNRTDLEGDVRSGSGLALVLEFLEDVHELLDVEFVEVRSALLERLDVEVELADTVGGKQRQSAGHLLNVGVTAMALGDIDRCEYELRQAASLVSQLVIETEEAETVRVSEEIFEAFNVYMLASLRHLERLKRMGGDYSSRWSSWRDRLDGALRDLRLRWGIVEDRSRTGSINTELLRVQLKDDDLEEIGRDELERWRTRR